MPFGREFGDSASDTIPAYELEASSVPFGREFGDSSGFCPDVGLWKAWSSVPFGREFGDSLHVQLAQAREAKGHQCLSAGSSVTPVWIIAVTAALIMVISAFRQGVR